MTENTVFQLCTRGIPTEHTQLFCWHNINPLVDFVERMVCSIAQEIIQQQWHSPSWASVGPLDANCRDWKKKRKPRTSRRKIKKTKTRIFSFLGQGLNDPVRKIPNPKYWYQTKNICRLVNCRPSNLFWGLKMSCWVLQWWPHWATCIRKKQIAWTTQQWHLPLLYPWMPNAKTQQRKHRTPSKGNLVKHDTLIENPKRKPNCFN